MCYLVKVHQLTPDLIIKKQVVPNTKTSIKSDVVQGKIINAHEQHIQDTSTIQSQVLHLPGHWQY